MLVLQQICCRPSNAADRCIQYCESKGVSKKTGSHRHEKPGNANQDRSARTDTNIGGSTRLS